MELDLTRLSKLSYRDFAEKKQPPETPTEPLLEGGQYKNTPKEETPAEGLTGGLAKLQREADRNKEEKDRSLAMYQHYQENIKRSSQLQTEILKGLQAGEDIYSLFLKAVTAISLMTDNGVFASQSEADLKSIYGAGLGEPAPLRLELTETETRLQRLREAQQRETEPDSLQRIERAIKAHESRVAHLKAQITKAEEKPA